MNWEQWLQTSIAVLLIILIFLIIWSKIMGQRILDTVVEIKEIISEVGK